MDTEEDSIYFKLFVVKFAELISIGGLNREEFIEYVDNMCTELESGVNRLHRKAVFDAIECFKSAMRHSIRNDREKAKTFFKKAWFKMTDTDEIANLRMQWSGEKQQELDDLEEVEDEEKRFIPSLRIE